MRGLAGLYLISKSRAGHYLISESRAGLHLIRESLAGLYLISEGFAGLYLVGELSGVIAPALALTAPWLVRETVWRLILLCQFSVHAQSPIPTKWIHDSGHNDNWHAISQF